MKIWSLIAFCLVTFLCKEVRANSESNQNEIKKEKFLQYTAYLYYMDETIKEFGNLRFVRGAILIRPQWLLSSAIDSVIINNIPKGFPKSKLMARLGASTIDDEFELDEEENEQEREIVELIRPANHNSVFWWVTDITLLKTALPFNTSLVGVIPPPSIKTDYLDKKCFILIFAKKFGNATEDRVLMKLAVELLPPSAKNCGPLFNESTMACGVDVDDGDPTFDTAFCQSNRGSPLICEKEVTGIQTYIDGECKQPFLYQLVSSWSEFIDCGLKNSCHSDYCSKFCNVVNKDTASIDNVVYSANTVTMVAPTEQSSVTTSSTTSPITASETPKTKEPVTLKDVDIRKEASDKVTVNYELRLEESVKNVASYATESATGVTALASIPKESPKATEMQAVQRQSFPSSGNNSEDLEPQSSHTYKQEIKLGNSTHKKKRAYRSKGSSDRTTFIIHLFLGFLIMFGIS